MPRKWKGKWFQRKSGVTPNRQGKGLGQRKGRQAQAPLVAVPAVRVTFPKAQSVAPAPAPTTRRRRKRKPRTQK